MRRRSHPAALLLSIGLLAFPAHAVVIHSGDLLVTDTNGARVFVVRVADGSVEALAPRLGVPNLLAAPAGIVQSQSTGAVFVVDNQLDELIRIDPTSGEQAVVNVIGGTPVSVGSGPWGLAIREQPGATEFWVSARGSHEIRHLVALTGFGIVSLPVVSNPVLASARGIALDSEDAVDVLHVARDDGEGYSNVVLSNGGLFNPLYYEAGIVQPPTDVSPGFPAWDVERAKPQGIESERVYLTLQATQIVLGIPFCDPANTAVSQYGITDLIPYHHDAIRTDIAPGDGDPLHCPLAVAAAADGRLYVTDTLLPAPLGTAARVVRVGPPGVWDTREVVASLPDLQGSLTLPSGLFVAPEPESLGCGWAALLTCAALAARRR